MVTLFVSRLFDKQSLQTARREREREKPDKGHGLKVRRVKKKTEGRNTDRRFYVTTCHPRG